VTLCSEKVINGVLKNSAKASINPFSN